MSIFRASLGVFDGSGSQIATVKTKQSAVAMARVVGGSVRKGGKVIYSAARNPVKKTKKKKAKRKSTAKRAPARKNKRKAPKKKAAARSNPGKALKSKIAQMKPRTWYNTTLSGAKVKVKRAGQSLIVKPATKKRSR